MYGSPPGGITPDGDTDSVEILNLNSMEWRAADHGLPMSMVPFASLQYKSTFLLVGGRGANNFFPFMLRYDPTTEDWTHVGEVLTGTGRSQMSPSMIVDSLWFPNSTF